MKTINYKGKGEHSVNELELIIEQQAEELHLFKSGQKAIDDVQSSLQLPTKKEAVFELENRLIDIKQHSSMASNIKMLLGYRIGFEEYDDWLRKR